MKKNLKEYLNKSVVEATWMEIQSDMDDGGEKTYSCETLHKRMNNKTVRKTVFNSLLVLLVIGALLGSSITIYSFSIPEYKRELYERRDETTSELTETLVVNPKDQGDKGSEAIKTECKRMIMSLFDFAEDGEEVFEYAFNKSNVKSDKPGYTKESVSLSIANVSGKAIVVNDINKYVPACILSIADTRIVGTLTKISRGFDETVEYGGESEQYFTNVWLNQEAVWFDYDFYVPSNLESEDQMLIVNDGEKDIIVSNSIAASVNKEEAIELGSDTNVDLYYIALPSATNLGSYINLLLVNRESHDICCNTVIEGELSYTDNGETVVIKGGAMTNWNAVYLKPNETKMETIFVGSKGYSLKTGLYTLTIKVDGVVVLTMDYLVIDNATYNKLTLQDG